MTNEAILAALSNVQEPDLGKDLVTLNMVKDILIEGNKVSFTVVLTTPACPMKDMIMSACVNAVKLLVNKEAEVTVNFTSNTTTNRLDAKTVLGGVKNIIVEKVALEKVRYLQIWPWHWLKAEQKWD